MTLINNILLTALLATPLVTGLTRPSDTTSFSFKHKRDLPAKNFKNLSANPVLTLRGGGVDDLIKDAWDWNANLGAPSALVAGAVVATFYDKREELTVKNSDAKWVKLSKALCSFLLLSSFALEIVCVFVTTVTGTMLLSQGEGSTTKIIDMPYNSALGLLHKNYEFEYLTARISFIQGLLHWLIAVGLETILPNEQDTEMTKAMNRFLLSTLSTLMIFLVAFYNSHMTFYKNYGQMLIRYLEVLWKRIVWTSPIRPLGILGLCSLCVNVYYGKKAFVADLVEKKD